MAAVLERLTASDIPGTSAELLALQAFVARSYDDWNRAIQLSEQALRATNNNPFLAGFIYAGLGDIYWLNENAARATDCHRCALEYANHSGDLVQMVDAAYSLAQFEILQGQLNTAEAVYEYGVKLLSNHGAAATPFIQIFAIGRATLYYERYQLAAARTAAEHGLAYLTRCAISMYAPFVRVELARIAAHQGDLSTARRALLLIQQNTQRMIARHGGQVPAWIGILKLREIEIMLAIGDLKQVVRWAIENWIDPAADAPVVALVQQFALAQICIACLDQPELLNPLVRRTGYPIAVLAEQLITSCCQRFDAWGLDGPLLELHTLRAVLYTSRDEHAMAHAALFSALSLAAPRRFRATIHQPCQCSSY